MYALAVVDEHTDDRHEVSGNHRIFQLNCNYSYQQSGQFAEINFSFKH